jgi:hypothetical protein
MMSVRIYDSVLEQIPKSAFAESVLNESGRHVATELINCNLQDQPRFIGQRR